MPRVSALRKKKKEVMLKARQCQKRKREESLMTACTPAAAAAASPSATPGSPAATRSPGAVIEVHTGLIVDYTVTSKICVHCKFHDAALRKKRITEEEYDRWKGSHDELCDKLRRYIRWDGGCCCCHYVDPISGTQHEIHELRL
ncbi:hypothetical protein O3P69_012785 [Scylla paramamosain]|uniref:Uncharacterized protein n=1 Tax=Scylla paramamosain TaxID=85552 RepID=A0AAW0SBC6_SCYPA